MLVSIVCKLRDLCLNFVFAFASADKLPSRPRNQDGNWWTFGLEGIGISKLWLQHNVGLAVVVFRVHERQLMVAGMGTEHLRSDGVRSILRIVLDVFLVNGQMRAWRIAGH